MYIIKASGEHEKFYSKKVYKEILKAGGSKKVANHVVSKLKKEVKNGMTSKKVLDIILKYLRVEPDVAARYDLKRAIMALGPSGFPFEKYFARILSEYGYKVKLNQNVKGKKVNQEIDIVAEANNKFMIECKYHNDRGKHAGLKEAMYTYARFLDIKKHGFDYPWLVTNTHLSNDAISYAKGVKLKVTGWRHPAKGSLKELIEKRKLYPITIIRSINEETKEKLYAGRIMVIKDLFKFSIDELIKKTGMSEKVLVKIIDEAKLICGGDCEQEI